MYDIIHILHRKQHFTKNIYATFLYVLTHNTFRNLYFCQIMSKFIFFITLSTLFIIILINVCMLTIQSQSFLILFSHLCLISHIYVFSYLVCYAYHEKKPWVFLQKLQNKPLNKCFTQQFNRVFLLY